MYFSHTVLVSLSSDGEHCCAVFRRDSHSVSTYEGYTEIVDRTLTLNFCTVYLPARTYEHGYPQMPHCDTVANVHERIAKPNLVPLQTAA